MGKFILIFKKGQVKAFYVLFCLFLISPIGFACSLTIHTMSQPLYPPLGLEDQFSNQGIFIPMGSFTTTLYPTSLTMNVSGIIDFTAAHGIISPG
jgi:hypothetical protein